MPIEWTVKAYLNGYLRETMDLDGLVGVLAELAKDIAADYGCGAWFEAAADLAELQEKWAVAERKADEEASR